MYLPQNMQPYFLGNFNGGVEDASVKNYYKSYNLTVMINKPTYL